jgi:hypothetical protein
VCDHWYPTKTCGRSNPTVRSSWDNVTSPDPGGRVSRERTRRLLAPRRSGARVDGMANPGELLINVVRTSKPKALRGLNQKVRGQVRGSSFIPFPSGNCAFPSGNCTAPQGSCIGAEPWAEWPQGSPQVSPQVWPLPTLSIQSALSK